MTTAVDHVLNRAVDPVVARLLRSRFQGLGGPMALLILRGRKSGRMIEVPVSYRPEGDTLLIRSNRRRAWWRNLEGGADLGVVVGGHERPAYGRVSRPSRSSADSDEVVIELRP